MKITMLGTGLMGAPMARALARAGHAVTAWNRTRSKADALADDGVAVVAEAAEAVAAADLVCSVLTDGPATAALLADTGLRAAIPKGCIWIDHASARPAEARAIGDDLRALGVGYLDAPVSGGTRGAEAGTLAIMVGGDATEYASALPALSAMGRPVHVGPTGSGMLTKLANQAIVGIAIGAVSEAMLLLERGGADPDAARDAMRGGFADSSVLQIHGDRMTRRDFTPGGTCATQLKDMGNVMAEASALMLDLPLSESIRDRYATLIEVDGRAGLDHAALFLDLLDRTDGGA